MGRGRRVIKSWGHASTHVKDLRKALLGCVLRDLRQHTRHFFQIRKCGQQATPHKTRATACHRPATGQSHPRSLPRRQCQSERHQPAWTRKQWQFSQEPERDIHHISDVRRLLFQPRQPIAAPAEPQYHASHHPRHFPPSHKNSPPQGIGQPSAASTPRPRPSHHHIQRYQCTIHPSTRSLFVLQVNLHPHTHGGKKAARTSRRAWQRSPLGMCSCPS